MGQEEAVGPELKTLYLFLKYSDFSPPAYPLLFDTIQAQIKQNKTKCLLARFSLQAVSLQPLELIPNDPSSNILVLLSYSHFLPKHLDHGPSIPLSTSCESPGPLVDSRSQSY